MDDELLYLEIVLDAKARIDALKDAGHTSKDLRNELQKMQKNYPQLRATIEKNNSGILRSAKKLKQGFSKMINSVKKLGQITNKVFNQSKKAMLALVATTSLAIGSYASFQKEMALTNTMLNVSRAEIKSYEKAIMQMSSNSGKSSKELAKALYDVRSAGVANENTVAVLEKIQIAATAGATQVTTAAKAGLATINSYGLEISELNKVFDLQFSTVKSGIITYEQLANNIGSVLPAASKLNVKLEEVYGSLAFITKMGISAEEGSTALARSFDAFISKADNLKKIGVEIYDIEGKFRGYENVISDLADKLRGLSDEQKNITLQDIGFDIRAAKAILPAINNLKVFKETLEEVRGSSGATQNAYKKATDSIAHDFSVLKETSRNTFMGFGALFEDEARTIMKSLTNLINKFQNMSDESKAKIKEMVIKIGLLSGAIVGIGLAVKLAMNPLTKFGLIGGVIISSLLVIWNNVEKFLRTAMEDFDGWLEDYLDRWKTALKIDVVIDAKINKNNLKAVKSYEEVLNDVKWRSDRNKDAGKPIHVYNSKQIEKYKEGFKTAQDAFKKLGLDAHNFQIFDNEIFDAKDGDHAIKLTKERYTEMLEIIMEARKRLLGENERIQNAMEGKTSTASDMIWDELKNMKNKVLDEYQKAGKKIFDFLGDGTDAGYEKILEFFDKLESKMNEVADKEVTIKIKAEMPNVYGLDMQSAIKEAEQQRSTYESQKASYEKAFKNASNTYMQDYMRDQNYSSRQYKGKTSDEYLERRKYELEQDAYYRELQSKIVEDEIKEKEEQLRLQEEMTRNLRDSVTNLFSNLATLTGNETFDKIGAGFSMVTQGMDSFEQLDFSNFGNWNRGDWSNAIGAAGAVAGVVGSINSYFDGKQEAENQKEIEEYNENTTALTELTTRIQQLNENLVQFDRNSIQSLAENPTASNIEGYMKNYQIMLDTINQNKDFGDVSMLVKYKYKNWYGKYKSRYKEMDFADEDISELAGYDLEGKQVEDLNLDELKEYREALENMDTSIFESIAKGKKPPMNSSQWGSSLVIGTLFGAGRLKYDKIKELNFDEYLQNIDEYIEGVERLQDAQENLKTNAIMESFEGINVIEQAELVEQFTEQLEEAYKTFYNTEEIEEYRTEIDATAQEMAENADTMVTAMNDVRSATVSAMNEGESAFESFATGVATWSEMIKNNVSQMTYNISFGGLDEQGEEAFRSAMERLSSVEDHSGIIQAITGNTDLDQVNYVLYKKTEQLDSLKTQAEYQKARINEIEELYDSGEGPFSMYKDEYDNLLNSYDETQEAIKNKNKEIEALTDSVSMIEYFDSIAEAESKTKNLAYTIQSGDWAGNVVEGSYAAIEAMKDLAREAGISDETIQAMFGMNQWEEAAASLRESAKSVLEAGLGTFDEYSSASNNLLVDQLKNKFEDTDAYKAIQEQIASITEEYLEGNISLEDYKATAKDIYDNDELESYRDTINEITKEIENQAESLEKAKQATLAAYAAYAETGDFRDFTSSFGESLYSEGLTSLQELFADTALIETFAKTLFDKEKIQAEIDEIMNNSSLSDIDKQRELANLYQSAEQSIKDNVRALGYDFTADDITDKSSESYGSEYYTDSSLAGAGESTSITYSVTINAENVYNDSAEHLAKKTITELKKETAGDL